MNKNFLKIGIAAIALLTSSNVLAQQLGGNPSHLKWKQVNGPSSRVIFPESLDSLAKRIYQINQQLDTTTLYSIGKNSRKWNIVLQPHTIVANAYVRMAPLMSEFYMTADQNNFTTGSIRWDDNLIIHENRHMQQFSNFNNGLTRVFSFLLGQEGQLLANGITVPDYFFEGDAVWQETLVSKQGRGRMPSFYNGMKSLWLQNKQYTWMKLRSGSLKDYLPNHYELGYMLVAYGYEKYGEDFWRKVTQDAVRFKGLFYAFNQAIQTHAGVSYSTFRKNALQYFQEKTAVQNQPILNNTYLTPTQKNNVVSYRFPVLIGGDSILVSKSSYKEISSFYLISNGKEKKIRVKDNAIDDYFSYRNGKIVYAAFRKDALRGNQDYSELRIIDVASGKQKNITKQTKYFSPDIHPSGQELLAVQVAPGGASELHRIDAVTGFTIAAIPNPNNYFFTQTKYINAEIAVSAVRHPDGKMALVKVNLTDGTTQVLTAFSYDVLGYPTIKNDTVYFSKMQTGKNGLPTADKAFALDLKSGKQFLLSDNVNGIYQPGINSGGDMIASAFTADGYLLQQINGKDLLWKEVLDQPESIAPINTNGKDLHALLSDPKNEDDPLAVSSYKKSFHLFNFHSARPSISATTYGYTLYGDNVLSSFSNSLGYEYNRNERSSSLAYNFIYAGAFPFLRAGLQYNYNRNIDTSLTGGIQFNSAKANLGFYVPLTFNNGKMFKFVNVGAAYNLEQIPYLGIGKNIWQNTSFKYVNAFINVTQQSRKALQHIHPRWAQSVSLNYRKGFNYFETGKLIGNSAFYFPGIGVNHSLVLNAAFQKRDTLPDFFSNNFAYARGYETLNTRSMFKWGVNYHIPLLYPDWGVGNIFFIQRIRTNLFYDHNSARARVNGKLTDIINRSTGTEIYFDGKIWNALSGSIGFRYSHLLDVDLQFPSAKGRFEIILPINIIPD